MHSLYVRIYVFSMAEMIKLTESFPRSENRVKLNEDVRSRTEKVTRDNHNRQLDCLDLGVGDGADGV